MIERGSPMVEVADRLDRVVDLLVDVGERFQALPSQAYVHRLELAEAAFFAVAIAEIDPAVGNRSFAADRLLGRSREALFGRLSECVPGEAEIAAAVKKLKSRKAWACPNFDGPSIAPCLGGPNKLGRILSIRPRRHRG